MILEILVYEYGSRSSSRVIVISPLRCHLRTGEITFINRRYLDWRKRRIGVWIVLFFSNCVFKHYVIEQFVTHVQLYTYSRVLHYKP
jgi:hypothetical protein